MRARSSFLNKFQVSFAGFILLFGVLNFALYHFPLMKYSITHIENLNGSGVLILLTVAFAAILVSAFLIGIFGLLSITLMRWLAIIFALINSIAFYFMLTYEAILTRAMMGNVFNTNQAETAELLSFSMVAYLLFLGIIPSIFLYKVSIRPARFLRKIGVLAGVLGITLAWGFINSNTWLWFDKNSKNIGGLTLPWAYVINGIRYGIDTMKPREIKRLSALTFGNPQQKQVVVLVIGEAARRDRFSLYGYAKATNELLAQEGVEVLPNAISCATYTTAGVACMLSHKGASRGVFDSDEPLPSYLHRFGVDVLWRSNNWGEMPLEISAYERVQDIQNSATQNGHSVASGHDELLLYGLKERIENFQSNKIFVVLHQSGSHGPKYYAKYPPSFERFSPVCRSVELKSCSSEELNNAYDNTIVYTDYLLSELIKTLRTLAIPAVMLYISDHGESLGEGGFYLHGAPNAIAPSYQRAIPFIVWMSDEFRMMRNLTTPLQKQDNYSQDYIFHSVLGAFGATSQEYNPSLDIFR
ncbi:MAG: phosphoethanolamine--lipid A transferase EptA [Wolinella sp.]